MPLSMSPSSTGWLNTSPKDASRFSSMRSGCTFIPDTTVLKVEGNFNVTGPLETFANAGGVHLARAILAEFAENIARLMAEQTIGATGEAAPFAEAAATASAPPPKSLAAQAGRGAAELAATASRPAAAELSGGKILWRILISWLRQIFSGKREAE